MSLLNLNLYLHNSTHIIWRNVITCIVDVRNDGLAVHGQDDPRDDEVYPEQENRWTVKTLPKVITVMVGTTVKTSVKTTVTATKGTPATRVMPCYNKTHRLKQQR